MTGGSCEISKEKLCYAGFISTRIAFSGTNCRLLYGVAGCPFWRGYECMDFYGETVGLQQFVRYIVMQCPLSGVLLYISTVNVAICC